MDNNSKRGFEKNSWEKLTSLTHEVVDDSVEMRSLVSESFLPCAQSSEVLACFGHDVFSEGHLNTAGRCSTNGDVKVANWVSHSDVENLARANVGLIKKFYHIKILGST